MVGRPSSTGCDKVPESEFFVLKSLRTYYFHDVRHGDVSKQRKKLEDIAAAFTRLIGRPVAQTRNDYLLAQLNLLNGLADLLDRINAALAAYTND